MEVGNAPHDAQEKALRRRLLERLQFHEAVEVPPGAVLGEDAPGGRREVLGPVQPEKAMEPQHVRVALRPDEDCHLMGLDHIVIMVVILKAVMRLTMAMAP